MKLINHVLDIRRLIQQAFDNRFSRMGLRADAPVPADQLSDSDHRQRRQKLDDIMQNHLNELGDYAEARQATINECVFTLFNRIAAIKVMESKELFPEIIRRRKENAGRSFEHNAWLEEHPSERNADREGLKHFLNDQFDKLGEHIPLYRSDYPYALMPTADELNEIIVQFNNVEEDEDCGADVWKGDDILGWLYENFNAVEKEALKASGEKTEYNKVSLQSQVYTPAWVVKFLVDNTLGKSYLEMYPESSIKEKYKIANAPTKQVKHPKDLRSMRLLDPACGSGNFLIYSFSLFYDLYIDQMENYGKDYSRRDIPKMIVENNLFGMDLDERAAQISQIALFIKARELGGHRSHWPDYTNVVSTHFFLDDYETVKDAFESIDNLDQSKRIVMKMIWDDLSNAYKFGSLVRVDETLDKILPNDSTYNLFAQQQMEDMFSFKHQFMGQLRQKVDELGQKGSNAYTLAKTNDAISFLEIISHKYDVVVANPPYTDSADFGSELKSFVEENYKKPYKFNVNLYACFIKRCCELSSEDGKIGLIHPTTFMFIKTYEDVRKYIIENTHINTLVDYGLDRVNLFGPGILLDASFYTLDKNKSDEEGVYFNISENQQEKYKKGSLHQALDDYSNDVVNQRVYKISQSKLKKIKSYPFIYWISDSFRAKFNGLSLDDILDIRAGIQTSNNNRFLRYWWEVDSIAISQPSEKRWVRYAKGGPAQKWSGNLWVTIDWKDHGNSLQQYLKSRNQDLHAQDYYFRPGITYSACGGQGITYRALPKDCLFDIGGSSIFTNGAYHNLDYLCGLLNSKFSNYVTTCFNNTVNKQPNDIKRIPFVTPDKDLEDVVSNLSVQNKEIQDYIKNHSITEIEFSHSPILPSADSVVQTINSYFCKENALSTLMLLNDVVMNRLIMKVYDLTTEDIEKVFTRVGKELISYPVTRVAKHAFVNFMESLPYTMSKEVRTLISEIEEIDDIENVSDFDQLYLTNNYWEDFCFKHEMNPIEVWYQYSFSSVNPSQRSQSIVFELLADIIRNILAKDDDGIIPLGDKMGEERLAIRIEREFMERGYSAAQFNQVCQLLGCDLEKYLQERFFQQLSDHLNLFMYLPKTPFIWHLTSGDHHAIELYISIYKWNRDTLFRIRSIYAANREAAIRDRLNSIDTSKTEGRLEATELRAMLEELNSFCQKIDDLLASGYDPKLDDGVGKNIAPLQKRKMLSYEVLNAGQLKKYLNADW